MKRGEEHDTPQPTVATAWATAPAPCWAMSAMARASPAKTVRLSPRFMLVDLYGSSLGERRGECGSYSRQEPPATASASWAEAGAQRADRTPLAVNVIHVTLFVGSER